MGVNASSTTRVAALPYKAAEAEGGRAGGRREITTSGCGGGGGWARGARLGRRHLLRSSARVDLPRPPAAAGSRDDGRAPTPTQLPAGRQDAPRGRNKTRAVPLANPRHSATPPSDNPIGAQGCMVDASLIQSHVWSPGRAPRPPSKSPTEAPP